VVVVLVVVPATVALVVVVPATVALVVVLPATVALVVVVPATVALVVVVPATVALVKVALLPLLLFCILLRTPRADDDADADAAHDEAQQARSAIVAVVEGILIAREYCAPLGSRCSDTRVDTGWDVR
jgi:hypothetical protein